MAQTYFQSQSHLVVRLLLIVLCLTTLPTPSTLIVRGAQASPVCWTSVPHIPTTCQRVLRTEHYQFYSVERVHHRRTLTLLKEKLDLRLTTMSRGRRRDTTKLTLPWSGTMHAVPFRHRLVYPSPIMTRKRRMKSESDIPTSLFR